MIVYPHAPQYPNLNVVFFKLVDDELRPFSDQCDAFLDKITNDPNSLSGLTCYSNHLASHVTHQYALDDQVTKYTENLLYPAIKEYIKRYSNDTFLSYQNLTLLNNTNSCWINFQKKHEFHPLHHHFGIFSFVIWLKIPYTISSTYDQENETAPEGDFHFVLRGETSVVPIGLKVDKSWEAMGVLFPSNLSHIVYPFYTSEEYRVTISGNFKVR